MFKIYDDLKINYGTCYITLNDKNKKVPHFSTESWKTARKIEDDKYNSSYAICGKESNIIVIDLDDMTNEYCKKVKELSNSNLVVQTLNKNGFHLYFKYDEDFNTNRQYTNQKIDIKSNNGFVFGINSKINGEIKYKLLTRPEDDIINEMSKELKEYLLSFDKIDNRKIAKKIQKYNKDVNKNKITTINKNDDIMIELLENLDIDRADSFDYWVMVGLALYNDGYDVSLYDTFSKRSNKYEEGVAEYKYNQFKKNAENKLTTATLWYWLYEDNEKKFKELRNKTDEKKFDFKIDLTESSFNMKKMYELLETDILEIGLMDYKTRFFSKSKSFQYFNYYHFELTNVDTLFNIKYNGKFKELTKVDPKAYVKLLKYNDFSFIDAWTTCIDKQYYKTMDFSPNEYCPKDVYNLFTGFVYDDDNNDYEEKNIKLFLDHIKYLVNDENEVYEYILNWLAHIIQQTQRKTEAAIVLYSKKEGVGKNAFTDLVSKIFKGYETTINLEHLTKNFNSILSNKLILIGDEISPKAKEMNNELKTAITRKEINIEYKGVDPIKIKDRSNFIFTTNNELAFRVSDEDRRYCLIECPTEKKDSTYFNNLYKDIDDDSKVKQFYNFLKTRDISNINIRNIPLTSYKKRNIAHNKPSYIQMIIENPEYFTCKEITLQFIKNELTNYEKDKKIYHKDNTDRKILIDMNENFSKYKQRNKHGIYYYMADADEFVEYINKNFVDDLKDLK